MPVEIAIWRVDGGVRLEQAVLAKAFRGELVPAEAELARRERRNYEPAGALLPGMVRPFKSGQPF